VRTFNTASRALRAPDPGWPPFMRRRRATATLTVGRRSLRPWLAGGQGTVARRAPAAFLWPLRATSAPTRTHPRSRSHGQCPATSVVARGLQTWPSLRRPHPEALQDQPQGRACGASPCFAERRPLRPSLVRDSRGACRRDGQDRALAHPVAAVCSNRPGLSRLIAGHRHQKSARQAPPWPHWPYLLSSGSRVRILPAHQAKLPCRRRSETGSHPRYEWKPTPVDSLPGSAASALKSRCSSPPLE
jgi:hypothetical protein